jgi:hypothetical protein
MKHASALFVLSWFAKGIDAIVDGIPIIDT